MTDKHGRVYSCSVPPLEGATNGTSPADAQVTSLQPRLRSGFSLEAPVHIYSLSTSADNFSYPRIQKSAGGSHRGSPPQGIAG